MGHWNLYIGNSSASCQWQLSVANYESSFLNDLTSRLISDAFLAGEETLAVLSALTMGCDSGVSVWRSPRPFPESGVAPSSPAMAAVLPLGDAGLSPGLPAFVFLRALLMETLMPSKYPEIPWYSNV